MSNHDIIVIGGSTGALGVLRQVFAALPADLPASLFVVRHTPADSGDLLTDLLRGVGPFPVKTAADGDIIERGHAYVGPAGRHLLVDQGVVRLGNGPRENLMRPAVDPLFRSAAITYGPRTIGVILSGMLDDGAAGLAAVKRCGGLALVQDPSDAEAREMPLAALSACAVDDRLRADMIAPALVRLAQEPAGDPVPVAPDLVWEVSIAAGRPSLTDELERVAAPAALSCPACGGVLSQMFDASRLRFRCQIGHAYTCDALDREQDAALSEAIGVALRTLEERHTLLAKMAADARRRGLDLSAKQFEDRAAEYRSQADTLRRVAIGGVE